MAASLTERGSSAIPLGDASPAPVGATAGGPVVVEEPATMNLLGLLMRSVLERALADPTKAKKARRLRGEVLLRGGRMQIVVAFTPGGISIRRAIGAAPRTHVEGDLRSLLEVALGRALILPVLTGRVRVGGNPFVLLRLVSLLRVTRSGPSP